MQSMRLTVLCLMAVVLFSKSLPAQDPPRNEQAIRSVVAEYISARNRQDAEAVRRLFTPDADQLVSNGEWRKGLDDLIRGTSASSRKEAGTSSIAVESVRFLDSTVAIADGRYRTTSLNGVVREMWTAIIVRYVNPDWRITAIRNMLPAKAQ
jgi:uncharacterized protein (TIGR02246 family)